MTMGKKKCPDCIYYDKQSGFCGFCMMKILKEIEEEREEKAHGNGQDNTEGSE